MSAAHGAAVVYGNRHALLRAAIAALLALLCLLLLIVAPIAFLQQQQSSAINGHGLPAGARPFLAMYSDAAAVYGVSAFLLMAVHEDETDYGRSRLPGVRSGVNSAGCCAGPMQFYIGSGALPAQGGQGMTWGGYRDASRRARLRRPESYPNRFTRPGHASPNVYDSYDAIYAAAKYFGRLGAGKRLDQRTLAALVRYKGTPPASIPFARRDYERAKELEQLASTTGGAVQGGPVPVVPGSRARVLPNGLAAAPANAPSAVKGMIAAGNRISNKPYLLVHYPTHIGNPTYDCSSSSSHVLWGGGVFGRSPWVSGAFMSYGRPGHGRWVSIYAHSGHMFLYVAGLRMDTGRYDTGPNAGESGPRWRTGPRPLGGFVVRHPRGL